MTIDIASALDLSLDVEREADRIATAIREHLAWKLKRRGAVLGVSGGIDSSVAAALCVRALGPQRVLGLLLPDADSAVESLELGQMLGEHLGIRTVAEDITAILDAAGCYKRRDRAIASVVPDYGPGYRSKLVRTALSDQRFQFFSVVIESPDGQQSHARLDAEAYLAIVAATNFKQRTRKMIEYHYADRYRYAVVGTQNRLEHDQGFFVKNGDGAADIMPIAHLYKTQVYQLAEYLGIPEAIQQRAPTTDTFSLPQTQEEFFFSVPYEALDVCLCALERGVPPASAAPRAGLTPEQAEAVYRDIESKRRATAYLHAPAVLLAEEHARQRASWS